MRAKLVKRGKNLEHIKRTVSFPQKKYYLQYVLKNDLNVLGFFGATYESAKTDDRNEFNRMIRFVKNQKEGVSAILVYSLDRFRRTDDKDILLTLIFIRNNHSSRSTVSKF